MHEKKLGHFERSKYFRVSKRKFLGSIETPEILKDVRLLKTTSGVEKKSKIKSLTIQILGLCVELCNGAIFPPLLVFGYKFSNLNALWADMFAS